MAAILQTTFSNSYSERKSVVFYFRFSLRFVPDSLINNTPALVQMMAIICLGSSHYLNQWCPIQCWLNGSKLTANCHSWYEVYHVDCIVLISYLPVVHKGTWNFFFPKLHLYLTNELITVHADVLSLNTLRLRQNGHLFLIDIFKCFFLNKNIWIPIKIPLKFFPKGPIYNIPSLVQIMALRQVIIWTNDG